MAKCYNCNYIGHMDFYWLISNELTRKAMATFEFSSDMMGDGDELLEVPICPKCNADQT